MDCLIIGCGLCGIVAARRLAEAGKQVTIIEKRNHIGGNIYDFCNHDGILIQRYGPHSFFTDRKDIKDYIEQFSPTRDSFVEYRTMINGQAIPMPFNFKSIDLLYQKVEAEELKKRLLDAYPGQEIISVTSLVEHSDPMIKAYGTFMFRNEYQLYSAKQWGRPIDSIEPAVFNRVPVYLSYRKPYQRHPYQFLPVGGFTKLASRMIDHPNITLELEVDALAHLALRETGRIFWDGEELKCPVLYTGQLDELFNYTYGTLPYRSLEFIWKTLPIESFQETGIVAYPQADKITRITEYTKLPYQHVKGKTTIAIEIPFEYTPGSPFGGEPYYPVLTAQTKDLYYRFLKASQKYPTLFLGGRLADYRYYNMDDVILRGWQVADNILSIY